MTSYDYYLKGKDAMENKDYDCAIEYLLESIHLLPHFKAYILLSYCFAATSDIEKMNYFAEQAYFLNPKNNEAAFVYANSLLQSENKVKAKEILLSVLNSNSTYGPALKLLSEIS